MSRQDSAHLSLISGTSENVLRSIISGEMKYSRVNWRNQAYALRILPTSDKAIFRQQPKAAAPHAGNLPNYRGGSRGDFRQFRFPHFQPGKFLAEIAATPFMISKARTLVISDSRDRVRRPDRQRATSVPVLKKRNHSFLLISS